jgi:hypothetical protein
VIEILRFLADHCGFLFTPGRFRFVDSQVDASFGGDAIVVLESKTLRLRLTRDRGQLLIRFQPINGKPAEWFSLGPLRGLLRGDRGGTEVLDPAWAEFLHESLDFLEDRFGDPKSAQVLVRQLHDRERLRAKELFG